MNHRLLDPTSGILTQEAQAESENLPGDVDTAGPGTILPETDLEKLNYS